jgi:flagellar hook-associated protein 2
MATSSVNIVNTLGAGSGVDTKALAQNLVDAERAPRKDAIDAKIKKEEAKITGHGAIKSLLTQLQSALAKINDTAEFTSIVPNNPQPNAFGVTASAGAMSGSYSIKVNDIAKATRLATENFSSSSFKLNDGEPFDLAFNPAVKLTERHTLTFTALAIGQSVTVGGLKLTATADMAAAEVAAAFSDPSAASVSHAFSGSLSGWTTGTASVGSLIFTSTTPDANVTDLAVTTAGDGGEVLAPATPKRVAEQGRGIQEIKVTNATPAGVVAAVNASTSSTGLSAQLINTGSGVSIIFSGQTGEANEYTLGGLPSGMTMRADPLETAQDADIEINGLPITSSTNRLSDTIPGLTLDLYARTTGDVRLDLNRQTAGIKDNLRAVVDAYNQFEDGLKVLGDRASKVEEFGGALAGDSILGTVRNQIRALFTKEAEDGKVYPGGDKTKAPLNPDVAAAWQVGIGFDRNGKMTLNEGKLDQAMTSYPDQVVAFFTANTDAQNIYSPAPGGMAGDAIKDIDAMLRSTGLLAEQSESAGDRIERYQEDLTKLEERMSQLLERYTKQFSVMESIVGQSNSTRTSLKSSFEGLMAMYTKS